MKRAGRPKWREQMAAAAAARRELPPLAQAFFAAGNQARQAEGARLHAFRLQTKHFRYTLEIFRPLYGPQLDGYLKALRQIQQILGELNDYQTSRELLGKSHGADAARVREYLTRQSGAKLEEFRQFWSSLEGQDARARWARYLARQARAR